MRMRETIDWVMSNPFPLDGPIIHYVRATGLCTQEADEAAYADLALRPMDNLLSGAGGIMRSWSDEALAIARGEYE